MQRKLGADHWYEYIYSHDQTYMRSYNSHAVGWMHREAQADKLIESQHNNPSASTTSDDTGVSGGDPASQVGDGGATGNLLIHNKCRSKRAQARQHTPTARSRTPTHPRTQGNDSRSTYVSDSAVPPPSGGGGGSKKGKHNSGGKPAGNVGSPSTRCACARVRSRFILSRAHTVNPSPWSANNICAFWFTGV